MDGLDPKKFSFTIHEGQHPTPSDGSHTWDIARTVGADDIDWFCTSLLPFFRYCLRQGNVLLLLVIQVRSRYPRGQG